MDEQSGLALTVDGLAGEDAETLKEWLQPVVEAVGAEVLVTDETDVPGRRRMEEGDGASAMLKPRAKNMAA